MGLRHWKHAQPSLQFVAWHSSFIFGSQIASVSEKLHWRSSSGEINLCRDQIEMGLVTFDGSTILLFIQAIQAYSACPSLCGSMQCVLALVLSPLGRSGEFCAAVNPVTRTACSSSGLLYASLIGVTLAISEVRAPSRQTSWSMLNLLHCVAC